MSDGSEAAIASDVIETSLEGALDSSENIENGADSIEIPESLDNVDEALEQGEEAAEDLKAELIRTLNLKVDGEDFTEELPFDATPEMVEYLTKQAQLAKMSNKRAQESAELRKNDIQRNQDIQDFMEYIKENPGEALGKLGIDVKDFSEKQLEKEVEKMQMTDEERKISELQEELESIKKREDDAKSASDAREQEALKDKYAAEFEKDLLGALDESAMPNNPEIVQRMNQYMRVALQNGIDLSFGDIIPLVSQSVNSELERLISSTPTDKLIKMLGEDQVKGIIGSRKKKVAPPTASSVKDTASGDKTEKKRSKVNMKDFFNSL